MDRPARKRSPAQIRRFQSMPTAFEIGTRYERPPAEPPSWFHDVLEQVRAEREGDVPIRVEASTGHRVDALLTVARPGDLAGAAREGQPQLPRRGPGDRLGDDRRLHPAAGRDRQARTRRRGLNPGRQAPLSRSPGSRSAAPGRAPAARARAAGAPPAAAIAGGRRGRRRPGRPARSRCRASSPGRGRRCRRG